jgi:hypothetical protein
VSIARTGQDAADRMLRVEGRNEKGRNGYWEKPIGKTGKRPWRFVTVRGHLTGHRLSRRGRGTRPAAYDHRYAGTIGGLPAEVTDFNDACSPARLRIHIAPGLPLDLLLHSSDGLRQDTRRAGLDDMPREYNGAIEVPRSLYGSLSKRDPRLEAWVRANLGGNRVTVAPLAVTATRMRFLSQCWALSLDGRPARPDRVRIPPDLGTLVGHLLELGQDGRALPGC